MIIASREERRTLARESAKWPSHLAEVPAQEWQALQGDPKPIKVLRSREFLVQVYDESPMRRLSIARTSLAATGRWDENITWDELQRLKRQAGYGDHDAVEIYPRDKDVVNVANMRHLWVFHVEQSIPFAWR